MIFWYKMDDGSEEAPGDPCEDGDGINIQLDRSGNSHDVSEAVNKPTWRDGIINGLPVARCDGTNDHLSCGDVATLDVPGDMTFFMVVQFDNFGDYAYRRFAWKGGENDWNYVFGKTNDNVLDFTYANGGWPTQAKESSGFDVGENPAIITIRVDKDANVKFYVDADLKSTVGGSLGYLANNEDLLIFTSWYNEYFDGDAAELILAEGALSDADLLNFHTYFSDKYNIAI